MTAVHHSLFAYYDIFGIIYINKSTNWSKIMEAIMLITWLFVQNCISIYTRFLSICKAWKQFSPHPHSPARTVSIGPSDSKQIYLHSFLFVFMLNHVRWIRLRCKVPSQPTGRRFLCSNNLVHILKKFKREKNNSVTK